MGWVSVVWMSGMRHESSTSEKAASQKEIPSPQGSERATAAAQAVGTEPSIQVPTLREADAGADKSHAVAHDEGDLLPVRQRA